MGFTWLMMSWGGGGGTRGGVFLGDDGWGLPG